MKKLILFTVCGTIALNVMAQDTTKYGKHSHEQKAKTKHYCAKFKDGKTTVIADTTEMKSEITFPNGNKLKTDGTLVMKDGSTRMLEKGECVDNSGNRIPKEKGKEMHEKNKDMYEKKDKY